MLDKKVSKILKTYLIERRKNIKSISILSEVEIFNNNLLEDSLRRLMVSTFPNLSKNYTERIDKKIFIKDIKIISTFISIKDLRYIDALNNIYEAWPENYFKSGYKEFINIYASALDKILSQL